MSSDTRWYEEAFRADYLRVYPHRDLESARPEVEFLLASGVRGRVLDLCCGFGRHALLLAEAGASVVGLDLSLELLTAARELPGFERTLRGRLVLADASRLPFHDARFDSVVNLFSSFGYLDAAGDERMLAEIARTLRPSGLAVFDLMNPSRVRATLVPASRREGEGFELRETRALADGGRRVVKDVELAFADGRTRRWREDVRLYEPGEFDALCRARGLAPLARFGGFAAMPFDGASARQVVLARKA